jgi:hypothetical protein
MALASALGVHKDACISSGGPGGIHGFSTPQWRASEVKRFCCIYDFCCLIGERVFIESTTRLFFFP